MPPKVNSYDESLAKSAYALATKWHTYDVMGVGAPGEGPAGTGKTDLEGWSTQQVETV